MKLIQNPQDPSTLDIDDPYSEDHPTMVADCLGSPENAQRLAACWNALDGLDLPPDTEAGRITKLLHGCPELPDDFDTDEGREAFAEAFTQWRAGLAEFGIQ